MQSASKIATNSGSDRDKIAVEQLNRIGGATMPRRVHRHAVVQPLDPTIRLIPLTRGLNAIVDADDYERLTQRNWYAWPLRKGKAYYAMRKHSDNINKIVPLHRDVIHCPDELQVDHINRNTLDNRKANLRIVDRFQNARNRSRNSNNKSGFKGVCWNKNEERWVASIRVNWKLLFLGYFDLAEDAARAYDKAAIEHFGEFAVLNFPLERVK